MSSGVQVDRRQLAEELSRARAATDRLFHLVRPEALKERPVPERHRIIFYVGHLEAFDWNMIGRRTLGKPRIDSALDDLFAFGIDPMDGNLPQDSPNDWPSLSSIDSYRQKIRSAVDECMALAEDLTVFWAALEHRMMHAETLHYLLHWLDYGLKISMRSPVYDGVAMQPRRIDIPEGSATLGVTADLGAAFAWDNEFEAHRVFVPAFSIDAQNVTNADYLRFVKAGGTPPKFWIRRNDHWWYRTMFAEVPLPLSWPVFVSHADAMAYAKFVGRSLPTEAQYHRAAYGTPSGKEQRHPWGDSSPSAANGNFNFAAWNPVPVSSYPRGYSAFGVADLVGNGWEWTATRFRPFPGFKPFSFYPGYSADFFDDRHYVLKGASPQTDSIFVRRSFRNWFQPNYPYIYATFRCVDN